MLEKKRWFSVLYIVPVVLIFSAFDIVLGQVSDLSMGSLLMDSIIAHKSVNDATRTFIIEADKLLYLVLFNLLFGTIIYKDFQSSCVYLFVRLKNRGNWFLKKALEVLGLAIAYVFVFLITNMWICSIKTSASLDRYTVKVFAILWIILTMLLTVTTIAINILSLHFGSFVSFLAVYGVVIVLFFLALMSGNDFIFKANKLFLFLNPMSGMVFDINNLSLRDYGALGYYVFLIILSFIIGKAYINKMDVGIIQKEFQE